MNRISKQIVLIARELEAIEKEAGWIDTLKNLAGEVKNTVNKAKENGDKDQRQRVIDNIRELISTLDYISKKSKYIIAMMILGQKDQVAKIVSRINDKNYLEELEGFLKGYYDKIQKTGITEALKSSGVRDYTQVYKTIGEQNQEKFDKLSKEFSDKLGQFTESLKKQMNDLLEKQKDKPAEKFDYGKALDQIGTI